VQDKGPVKMADLQQGDHVLTGGNTYQPVYAFGHYKADEPANFIQLTTASASTLEMTGQHLVYVADKVNPVRADSIKVGDVLRSASDADATVIKISNIQRKGVYAPLTPSGSVVVDGVLASSYISLQSNAKEFVELQGGITPGMSQHDYVHLGLSPFRLVCMGISSSLCSSYNEDGMPHYAAFGIKLNKWAHAQNVALQTLTLLAVILLSGVCMMLENTFSATYAPLVVFAAGFIFALLKASCVSVRKAKTI
jgi:hypothetical protein